MSNQRGNPERDHFILHGYNMYISKSYDILILSPLNCPYPHGRIETPSNIVVSESRPVNRLGPGRIFADPDPVC